jgi:hypothetical protein
VPLIKQFKKELGEIMTLRKLQREIIEKEEEKDTYSIPLKKTEIN